jgi:WD40 repeat protein
VFITKDGHLKILDFGLAKLRQHTSDFADKAHAQTFATEPGVVLGTVAYMSPEQVQGKATDHRSDIFSLGEVLYEMLAGCRAFEKPSGVETMNAILTEDPPAVSQVAPNVPMALQRVVHRCLEKNPEQRFHAASDLGYALEALSESGSGPAVAVAPRHRAKWPWLAAAGVIGVAGLVAAWCWTPPAVPLVESVVQLTEDSKPKSYLVTDGSRIYFLEGTFGRKIAQVSTRGGPTVRFETNLQDPQIVSYSRDTSELIALASFNSLGAELWSIPLPAGETHRIGGAEAWDADAFPDGRLILATGKDVSLAERDGSNPRKLVSMPGVVGDVEVSPDSGKILFRANTKSTGLFEFWTAILGVNTLDSDLLGPVVAFDVMEVGADGKGMRTLRKANPDECCFHWSADGKYLLYSARAGARWDLWALPMRKGWLRRSGEPVRLTNGPQSYPKGAIPNRDGKQIFAVGSKARGEAVRYDMNVRQFVPILPGISATDVTWSNDKKWVAYTSYPDHTLWRSRSDGSERIQLAFPPAVVFEPYISPDGTKVVFDNMADFSICVVDMRGGQPRRLIERAISARWSPDGGSIVVNAVGPDWDGGLEIVDVRTGKRTTIPSSKGKVGAFWLDQDTLGANDGLRKLVTFNRKTETWTELATFDRNFANQINSPDGKYVYVSVEGTEPSIQRVRVADHHIETIIDLKDFIRVLNFGLPQLRVAPDGSPLLTRDTDPQQIYALNVRWP